MEELSVGTAPHPTIKRIVAFGDMAETDVSAVGHAVRERFGSLRGCEVRAFAAASSGKPEIDFMLLPKATGIVLGAETLQVRVSHGFQPSPSGVRIGYVAQSHVFHVSDVPHAGHAGGKLYPAFSSWVQLPHADDYDALIDAFLAGRDFCKEATNGRFSYQYFLAQAAELAVSFVPGL